MATGAVEVARGGGSSSGISGRRRRRWERRAWLTGELLIVVEAQVARRGRWSAVAVLATATELCVDAACAGDASTSSHQLCHCGLEPRG
eukprot:5848635-Alexandrium_andersonii.AAC.1